MLVDVVEEVAGGVVGGVTEDGMGAVGVSEVEVADVEVDELIEVGVENPEAVLSDDSELELEISDGVGAEVSISVFDGEN